MRKLIYSILTLFLLTMAVTEMQASDGARSSAARYFYIEAVRQQNMGHYINAMELFSRCLDEDPNASEAHHALGAIYMALNQDSIGMRFLKRAVELEPSNTEYAERLARTFLYKDQIDNAAEVYERISKMRPERTDFLEILIRIYEQQHDYEKMLAVLNRLEIQEGKSEELTLTKMQAYSFNGDQEGAYRELKSLIDAHPNDLNLQVMLGNWMVSNSRKEEARDIFMQVLAEEPDNAQAQISLLDLYVAEDKTADADSMMYSIVMNPRTEASTRNNIMRTWVVLNAQNGNDTTKIMDTFGKVLSMPQENSDIAELKVSYLKSIFAPQDSIRKAWEEVLAISPENIYARVELIQIMWQDSIDENVIRECKKAVEYVPEEPSLYYYLALAQSINEHYDDALVSAKQVIAYRNENTKNQFMSDAYYLLAEIYHKKGMMQEVYEAYDSCLVYEPDRISCLNNYAYFLSLDKKDLKKAERMSYKTIAKEPDNSMYLDTYAWILYQQKRYEEAKIYIEQALHCDTDSVSNGDGEFFAHAGDIYLALGMKKEAVEMWERALNYDVEDKATIRKKIKKHK